MCFFFLSILIDKEIVCSVNLWKILASNLDEIKKANEDKAIHYLRISALNNES